jgi:hypothetical protein
MKNFKTLFGLTAILVVIMFTLGSCIINVPGDDNGGTTTSALNGMWQQDTRKWIVEIRGSNGTMKGWGNNLLYYEQSAVDQHYIEIGKLHFRNLEKTDDLTWIGQGIIITGTYTTAPAWGVEWEDCTLRLDESGNYFRMYYRPGSQLIATYRRY